MPEKIHSILDAVTDTKGAAKILGVRPDYVRRLCIDGVIPARRLDCGWIMLEEDVAAYQPKDPRGRPRTGG